MIWISLPLSGSLATGSYRVTFNNVSDFSRIPPVQYPQEFNLDIGGGIKRVRINSAETDLVNRKYILQVDLLENPVPALALAVGLFAFFGVASSFMNLESIERSADFPVAAVALGVVAVLIIVFIARRG